MIYKGRSLHKSLGVIQANLLILRNSWLWMWLRPGRGKPIASNKVTQKCQQQLYKDKVFYFSHWKWLLNGADEVFKIAHSRNSDGQDDSDGKVAEDWDVVRLIPPPPPIEYRLWRSNPEKADQTIAAGALKTIAMATLRRWKTMTMTETLRLG